MKTNFFSIVVLLFMGLIGCTTNELTTDETINNNPKKFTVRLACAGELDVTQQPLSRFTSSNSDVYAVSVSYKPQKETNFKGYARGIFDDISKLELEVLENHDYLVYVYLVADGKNIIHSDSTLIDGSLYRCFAEPFKMYDESNSSKVEYGALTNRLTYSETLHFDNWNDGMRLKDNTLYNIVENVETYYGKSGQFTPTSDGEVIPINMKRMTYGVKFIAGDFLTTGKLKITMQTTHYNKTNKRTFTLTPENQVYETTLAYQEKIGDWYDKDNLLDAKDTHDLWISWNKNDSTVVTLKKKTIQVNRLKQTLVNINMHHDEDEVIGNSSFAITFEDIDLTVSDTNQYTYGENDNEYESNW